MSGVKPGNTNTISTNDSQGSE